MNIILLRSNISTLQIMHLGATPLTGVKVVGSPVTYHNSVRFRSVDDPWGHTTDWR